MTLLASTLTAVAIMAVIGGSIWLCLKSDKFFEKFFDKHPLAAMWATIFAVVILLTIMIYSVSNQGT